MPGSSFALGTLYATPGVLKAFEASGDDPLAFIFRHATGDWGDLGDEDKAFNDEAVEAGDRLLSAYHLTNGVKIYIITDGADESGVREATTVLLPSEY